MSQKTLEDVLREAAKSGRLNHVSLAFTQRGWEASYRGVDDKDYRFVTHSDPACAMRAALTGRPGDVPVPEKILPAQRAKRPAVKPVQADEGVFGDLM